jgi:hypothetical protein
MSNSSELTVAAMGGARRLRRLAPLSNGQFRRLWLSTLFSGIGDWSARIALTIFVYSATSSAFVSSSVAALSVLPWLGPGQWVVRRVGNVSHRTVLVWSDLFRAGLWCGASFKLPIPVLLIILLVAEMASVPFASRRSLAVRTSVDPPMLPAAVAIGNATFQATVVLGYLLGSASLFTSLGIAMRFNAATFLVSALCLSGLESGRLESSSSSVGKTRRFVLWREQTLRNMTLAVTAAVLVAAGLEVLLVPFVLHGTRTHAWTGVAAAVIPGSTIVGLWVFTRWEDPSLNLRWAARAVIGVASASALTVGLAPVGLAGIAVALTAGTAFAATSTAASVVLARLPTDKGAAITFSSFHASMQIGQAAGALILGFVADQTTEVFAVGAGVVLSVLTAAMMLMTNTSLGSKIFAA